jgi:excisionase family DNA binding protein
MQIRILELLKEIKNIVEGKSKNRWITLRKVCDYTSLSESTIRRAVHKGNLKASHSTGKLLFKVSSVDRWLNG